MPNYSRSIVTQKEVAFAEFSEMKLVPKDKPGSKWYSSQEIHRLRQELIEDVWRTMREIERTTSGAVTPGQLLECIGVEDFVTQGLARNLQEKKRAHVDAILSEQKLQRKRGVCDPEALRSISKKSSCSARNRARKLAIGYMILLKD